MPCYAHNDIGLMTISRAGTASVQAACPWPQVSLAEYADIPNRVAFLREPHARMEASYGLHLERSFDLPLESFADFVSRVCTVWQTDPHIVGQFCQCHYGSTFLPTRIVKWDFEELAELLGIGPIAHLNKSRPRDCQWNDETRELFDRVYARDLEMWEDSPAA